MAEERVARNTHSLVQRLEDLRIEHLSLISSLESPKNEKSDIILNNIKSIDVGLDEAQLMMEFTLHLQNVEVEKQKLNAQIQQLNQEINMLKGKLSESNEKLAVFEKMVADYDKQKDNTEFLCDERDDQNLEVQFIETDESTDDENDCLTPKAIYETDGNESEALSRFNTLQGLVIRYALEGKYEMALLLCKRAKHYLEKTTIGRFHPYVAAMVTTAGLVYDVQNKYKKAATLLHEAILERTRPVIFERF